MIKRATLKPLALAVTAASFTPVAIASEVLAELVDSSAHTLNVYFDHFTDAPSNSQYDARPNHVFVGIESSAQAYVGDAGVIDLKWLTLATSMDSSHHGVIDTFDRSEERSALLTPIVMRYVYEADDYDFAVGLDTVNFGYGELHNSVDAFGRANTVHPGHAYDLGVWQAALTYYIEDDILYYHFMPVDSLSPQPVDSNRWQGSGGDGYDQLPNGDDVEDLDNKPLSVTLENMGHLLRYEATRSGYDYYLFGYQGPSPYAVIVANNDINEPYRKLRPVATQVGAGVSVIVGAHKLYGDAVVQHTHNQKDEDFIRATLGTQLKESNYVKSWGINEVALSLEYAFDTVIREQGDATDLIFSSSKTRSGRNSLYTRLEIEHTYNWGYAVGYAYNFNDGDSVATLGAQFKVNDSLKYFAGYTYSDGDEGTPYGAAAENNMLEVGAEWSF
ncbi:MAG: hypothetical protein ACPGMR_02160 [Pontibacterium sp.]